MERFQTDLVYYMQRRQSACYHDRSAKTGTKNTHRSLFKRLSSSGNTILKVCTVHTEDVAPKPYTPLQTRQQSSRSQHCRDTAELRASTILNDLHRRHSSNSGESSSVTLQYEWLQQLVFWKVSKIVRQVGKKGARRHRQLAIELNQIVSFGSVARQVIGQLASQIKIVSQFSMQVQVASSLASQL